MGTAAALTAIAIAMPPSVSGAPRAPAPDITRMDYAPIGSFKPGDAMPSPLEPPSNPNPSGKWNAYDVNVYETLNYPARHPGDTSADDPPGSGDPRHGFCAPGTDPNAAFLLWGKCPNHQLEFQNHFQRAMNDILADFGGVVKRYPFTTPGTGTRGVLLDAAAGSAINIMGVVPGAEHPEESVVVAGHFDQTDSGPASAWDSSEGHATVIRIAKIMTDYWRATGTRPSVTVKFATWDSEESGTFGSIDYVNKNIPPGEESKVRGYFNLDPCAGAYPAFRNGNPASRVPEVLQLADPLAYEGQPEVKSRVERFNARALEIVEEVFDHLDDRLETVPGSPEIFVSSAEAEASGGDAQTDEIVVALGGLLLFSSDYANFANVGIPIFNLFPDYFGPHADATPASIEGITILHTPRDNLTTVNALTSADASGQGASEGWMKGLEMCAHLHGWYLLQPEMGGAQIVTPDPVAYFEALPNEAFRNQEVTFDASGSSQYLDPQARSFVPDSALRFEWDFGDGSQATGRVVEHAYDAFGRYTATLTVRNVLTGQTDGMSLPIQVSVSNLIGPVLQNVSPQDDDGRFTLEWIFEGETEGLSHFAIEEATDPLVPVLDDAEGQLDERWEAGPGKGTIQPWQRSDSAQPKTLGNKRHSGASSYWTGAFPSFVPAGVNMKSSMTLTQAVAIPRGSEALLTYWSLFGGELDDSGIVEVAIDDGSPDTPLRWETVDFVSGSFAPDEPEPLLEDLTVRRVDLSRFAGRPVLLRFSYVFGPSEGNRTQPAGWYVDDIRLETAGWEGIGQTQELSFEVRDRVRDTYGYRVFAVYSNASETAPSDTARVDVTRGASRVRARTSSDDGVKPGKTRRPLPATGVGAMAGLGAAFLAGAAVVGRVLRKP